MPAPLAKGIIIAASIIVAAGLAIYESPEVRRWIDQSRRKVAHALHSLGDDIQPRRPSESQEEYEARKVKDETVRRKRMEFLRKAQEEGISVDLDELARIGRENDHAPRRVRRGTSNSQKSFDELVGHDGRLRRDEKTAAKATGADKNENAARRRGLAGFAAGAAVAAGNPFADDQVLFDQEDEKTTSAQPLIDLDSRESTATVEAQPVFSPQSENLIDLTPTTSNESEPDAGPEQSLQSITSSTSEPESTHLTTDAEDSDDDILSTGTLTPRSERSAYTTVSAVESQINSIASLSVQNDTDHDGRSEAFSEVGFADADFSDIGSQRGVMTPSSWTDVGSDDDSEWEGRYGNSG
ncbi:hypothetical protein M011DRAFT_472492 [Sporormia fimetaria CBS 119925]|uniref:Uncharacterized protein n=1 Tax=Sporormia fimetaria CBS 119925 TaxID=1340428 RepID=A0A6A6UYL1_9PLEO|nr:hypothetical protein M011DRAFT_472492 [Sporormia fimetaria CBS 119925]